jgi:hypothetical protein
MTTLARIEAASSRLKVFPLPSAVLFPHTALPLHIFEPRYRALVKDCLEGDQVMALAQLAPGWDADYQGRPPMLPICCAGLLAWHEELPDGRYNILLQGLVRARILAEPPSSKPYREVRVKVLADAPYVGPEEELVRQALLELSTQVPPGAAEALLQLAAKTSGGALADVVAGSVIEDAERRQQVLDETDVSSRLRSVLSEVGELLARLGAGRPQGRPN